MIQEYDIFLGATCESCKSDEDVVMSEDGEMICTDCLFEKTCEEMFKDTLDDEDEDYDE